MNDTFALDDVLALGIDLRRESLDVIGICFPEEIVLDESFDNTRPSEARSAAHLKKQQTPSI